MTDLAIFDYLGIQVRTVLRNGDPWFVAADVCSILDFRMAADALRSLDDDEKGYAKGTHFCVPAGQGLLFGRFHQNFIDNCAHVETLGVRSIADKAAAEGVLDVVLSVAIGKKARPAMASLVALDSNLRLGEIEVNGVAADDVLSLMRHVGQCRTDDSNGLRLDRRQSVQLHSK